MYDTSGYLHVNNPKNIEKCNLVDSTHLEKKAKNYTRARLDYFLISKNSTYLVSKIGMDRVSNLSNHRPIHLHMSFSSVLRGNGIWRFNNELLKYLKFIQGCNETIMSTMLQYSGQLRTLRPMNFPDRSLLMLSLTSAKNSCTTSF